MPQVRHPRGAHRIQPVAGAGSGLGAVAVGVAVGGDVEPDVVAGLGARVPQHAAQEDAHRVRRADAAVVLDAQADHHEGDVVGGAVVVGAGDVVDTAAAGDDRARRSGEQTEGGGEPRHRQDASNLRIHRAALLSGIRPAAGAPSASIWRTICSVTVSGSRTNRSSPV